MFQATSRGWASLAVGLMLLPALAAYGGRAQAQPGGPVSSGRPGPAANSSPGSPQLEAARKVMKQAREALDRGDFARARQLALQARDMRVPMQFWDETPDHLLAEVQRKSTAAGGNKNNKAPADPRQLVKLGRQALEAGKLDQAQDLARQAAATRPDTRWGLFEDSPSSLLRDVLKAKGKKDRADSVQLLGNARTLFEKKAATDAERLANFDEARNMALEAERLHGHYSIWDLGDRPSKLVAQIDTSRARLAQAARKPTPRDPKDGTAVARNNGRPRPNGANGPQVANAHKPAPFLPADGNKPGVAQGPGRPNDLASNRQPGTNPVQPASGRPSENLANNVRPADVRKPADPAAEANKKKARDLVREGRAHMNAGRLVEAKAKFVEAQRLHVGFGQGEDSPEVALQQVHATGTRHIALLLREADERMGKKDRAELAKAEAALNAAQELAVGLGLDTFPVVEKKRKLVMLKSPRPNPAQPAVVQQPAPRPAQPVVQQQPAPRPTPAQPAVAQQPQQQLPPVVVQPLPLPLPPVGGPPAVAQRPQVPADPGTPFLPGPAAAPAPSQPVAVAPQPEPGREMLNQARLALRRGDNESARRFAVEAYNQGAQVEAAALLRTVDAEDYNQRRNTALRSFDGGLAAYQGHDFRQALAVFQQIDPALLPAPKQAQMKELMINAGSQVAKAEGPGRPGELRPANFSGPGVAQVNDAAAPRTGADSLLRQQEALQEVQFQKLRAEGLRVQTEATAKFGKGETDAAMKELQDYLARLKAAPLDPAKVALLQRPVEHRMDQFKLLKRQQDFFAKEAGDRKQAREELTGKALRDQNRKEKVAAMMKQYHELDEAGKYREAEMLAMQAKELDPDSPELIAAAEIAKFKYRTHDWQRIKDVNEERFLKNINEVIDEGPVMGDKEPLSFDKERWTNQIKGRPGYQNGLQLSKPRSNQEREIEMKLGKPIPALDFKNTPLSQAIDDLRILTGLNIVLDTRALEEENISPQKPVSLQVGGINLKSALNILLRQAHLTHVVEDDVLKVTTDRHAKGKLMQRVFPVADLVIPIDNYATPNTLQMQRVLEQSMQAGRPTVQGITPVPYTGPYAMGSGVGQPVGTSTGGGMFPQQAGTLQNNTPAGPMGASSFVTSAKNTMEEQLIRLITNTVKPMSWAEVGGPGTIDYYPIGLALVVNQTPDVIEQVAELLEALRRLQDLEVAVEVRLIALAESFYERIGMDFAMNIKTHTRSVEPQFVTQSFAPPGPFLNDNNMQGQVIGLTPALTPTPNLDIPIQSNSFNMAVPPFGGYPFMPGMDGGISLGLAFLNDIQVFMFMEAAQGDRRTNVMQAPKLTLFNGQTASLNVGTQQFFVLSVTVISVNGQIVFVPQNTPIPLTVTMTIQAVVSGDRRFVRLNMNQSMTNLSSATVPLFPITTFVTPQFEGGAQGQPIPFTQFVQQPAFQTLFVMTTVNVPDGGTVVLGGLKTLSEGRNEFGPPVLSKIPYINRLFKNVGYGREAESLMMMVTPRIIINAEEEERQTGIVGGGPAGNAGP